MRNPMVLKTDVSTHRSLGKIVGRQSIIWLTVEVNILHLQAIQSYPDMMPFAEYNEMVPFTGFFRSIL
jgi:hypothetical protein